MKPINVIILILTLVVLSAFSYADIRCDGVDDIEDANLIVDDGCRTDSVLSCSASSFDLNADTVILDSAWYKVDANGNLVLYSNQNSIFVSDADTEIYVCEIYADDGTDKSIPMRKAYTLAGNKTYIPFGTFEGEVDKFGAYSGRSVIPKTIYGIGDIDYSVKTNCVGGSCGVLNMVVDAPSPYLRVLLGTNLNNSLRVSNNRYFKVPVNSTVDSNFPRVNSLSLDPYYVESFDSIESDYNANIEFYTVINYFNGTSVTTSAKSIAVDGNVRNVTVFPRLVVSHENHLVPPYILDSLALFTVGSSDTIVLDPIVPASNTFIPRSRGFSNVTMSALPAGLLGNNINPGQLADMLNIFVDIANCPNNLVVFEPNIHVVYNKSDSLVRSPFYFQVRDDLGKEYNYSELNVSLNSAVLPAFYALHSISPFNQSVFESSFSFSGDNGSVRLDISSPFTSAIPGSILQNVANLIEFTHKPDYCAEISATADVLIEEGEVGCHYYTQRFDELFYYRNARQVRVFESCDGVPIGEINSSLISVGSSANFTYLPYNSGLGTCDSSGATYSELVQGNVCLIPDYIGSRNIDLYVNGSSTGLSMSMRTECSYDAIVSYDADLTANTPASNAYPINDSFVLDDYSLVCKNATAGDCRDSPSNLMINSSELDVSGNIMTVNFCRSSGNDVAEISLKYDGNVSSYCPTTIDVDVEFDLPYTEIRETVCTDDLVNPSNYYDVSRNHMLSLSENYVDFTGIAQVYPNETNRMILSVLDTVSVHNYLTRDLSGFFSDVQKNGVTGYLRSSHVIDILVPPTNVYEPVNNGATCSVNDLAGLEGCFVDAMNQGELYLEMVSPDNPGDVTSQIVLEPFQSRSDSLIVNCLGETLIVNNAESSFVLNDFDLTLVDCNFKNNLGGSIFELYNSSVTVLDSFFIGTTVLSEHSVDFDLSMNRSVFDNSKFSSIELGDAVNASYVVENNNFCSMTAGLNAWLSQEMIELNYCDISPDCKVGCPSPSLVENEGPPKTMDERFLDLFAGIALESIGNFDNVTVNYKAEQIHFNRILDEYISQKGLTPTDNKAFFDEVGYLTVIHALEAACTSAITTEFASVSLGAQEVLTLNQFCPKIITSIIFDPGFYLDNSGYRLCYIDEDITDESCCALSDGCVYEGTCYSSGSLLDIDGDNIWEVCEI